MNKKAKQIVYKCGCSFDLIENSGKNSIKFDPDIANINLDCSKTWELIGDGNTKGIFQLESRLGKSIAKKLKPENIEQLSALISILRPGSLEAYRDGKSVTQHYIDRKNGLESIDYFHPALKPILENTLGELIYQEQAMKIASDIAGFSLQESDELRKAIGKKLADKMAEVKKKFLEGAEKVNIISKSEAEEVFGWIEKAQRYSFNKSHGVSYAINAYLSAYAKAHFPRAFFASYLKFAKNKINPQDEIKALIQNAREMNIDVVCPNITKLNEEFILSDGKIYFGITDIKGVGSSVFSKIQKILGNSTKHINEFNWLDLLFVLLININSSAAKALIESNACLFIGKTRTEMLFELDIALSLTKKEQKFIISTIEDKKHLNECLKHLIYNGKVNKNRQKIILDHIEMIKNPPYSLEDSTDWLVDIEDSNLGCSITCSKIDMYDISMTNTCCKNFKNYVTNNNIIIGGEIESINIIKTKKGKTPGESMAFVSISDSTGVLDSVIFFPEVFRKYKQILFEGNIIIVSGKKTKSNDGLIVDKAYIAKT